MQENMRLATMDSQFKLDLLTMRRITPELPMKVGHSVSRTGRHTSPKCPQGRRRQIPQDLRSADNKSQPLGEACFLEAFCVMANTSWTASVAHACRKGCVPTMCEHRVHRPCLYVCPLRLCSAHFMILFELHADPYTVLIVTF